MTTPPNNTQSFLLTTLPPLRPVDLTPEIRVTYSPRPLSSLETCDEDDRTSSHHEGYPTPPRHFAYGRFLRLIHSKDRRQVKFAIEILKLAKGSEDALDFALHALRSRLEEFERLASGTSSSGLILHYEDDECAVESDDSEIPSDTCTSFSGESSHHDELPRIQYSLDLERSSSSSSPDPWLTLEDSDSQPKIDVMRLAEPPFPRAKTRRGRYTPTSSARGSDYSTLPPSPQSQVFSLPDVSGKHYEDREVEDTNYAAITDTYLDTTLGSYNTGDTEAEWRECLEFFMFDAQDYIRRTEGTSSTSSTSSTSKTTTSRDSEGPAPPRKRAGMKRLPGMRISLFDYQLMGVFRLLKLLCSGVRGGFLCDDMGLGKTVEMLALVVLIQTLREMKADVRSSQKGGKSRGLLGQKKHLPPGSSAREKCPLEVTWGIKCCCHYRLTAGLVECLPEGPTLMLTPARTLGQLVEQTKQKLDDKLTKLRVTSVAAAGVEKDAASPSKASTPRSAAKGESSPRTPTSASVKNEASASQSLIVISSWEDISERCQAKGLVHSKYEGLMPGIILLDEFHEYAAQNPGLISWLFEKRESSVQRGIPSERSPLFYFVSGTPIERHMSELHQPLRLLHGYRSSGPDTPPSAVDQRVSELVERRNHIDLVQSHGERVTLQEFEEYRRSIDELLDPVMVRRVTTDSFRGKRMSGLADMKVTVHHLPVPREFRNDVQGVSNQLRSTLESEVDTPAEVDELLNLQDGGESLLLPLRLASTFPATAATYYRDHESTRFTDDEIAAELAANANRLDRTRFWAHIPRWASNSPKLQVVLRVLDEMLADNTPVEGEMARAKKLVIFTPTEAEGMILYGYLFQHHRLAIDHQNQTQNRNQLKPPVWLHPGMSTAERDSALARFRHVGNEAANVLVASLRTAGAGLDLAQARYALVTGLGARKTDTQQAFFRVHRVGQKSPDTRLHLLVCRGNPAERRFWAQQAGVHVEVGDAEAWTVYGEDEDVPEDRGVEASEDSQDTAPPRAVDRERLKEIVDRLLA